MELLVAIGLMLLVMSVISMIFSQSSSTYRDTQERLLIYDAASFALDCLDVDLKGCLPLEEGNQNFILENLGSDDEDAQDKITFTSTVAVSGKMQTGQVMYYLEPDTDPSILTPEGEPLGETSRTKRPLYALRREFTSMSGTDTAISDLCHYVLSFNIEYFDSSTNKYRQISDTSGTEDIFLWPIGDNNPQGEAVHKGLRVTLVVVAGGGEHQERVIPKVIWLPLGK